MNDSARAYHTKTSYDRLNMGGHFLDWANQPTVFKVHPGFKEVELPRDLEWPEWNLSQLVAERGVPESLAEIDARRLARILVMSHAITAKTRHGGGDFYYRSVASAGALYPFELYVALGSVPGLEDGLYHHDVTRQGLTLLRTGNGLADVCRALGIGTDPSPGLVFFLTSIFFRSSWKYRDRAYRYHLLDTGHLAENLALALRAERVRFTLHYDFPDEQMNRMLALDTDKEVCLAVAPVWGSGKHKAETTGLEAPEGDLTRSSQVASREVDYPLIHKAHSVTAIAMGHPPDDVGMAAQLGLKLGEEIAIPRYEKPPEVVSYPEAVFKRRSMRNFVRTQMPMDCFSTLLTMLCEDPPDRSSAEPAGNRSLCIGFLADNVERLDPGFYLLDRQRKTFSLAARGSMMDSMTHICLGQGWLANCAIHFLFLTNLEVLENTYGPRGYRHVMLTAGRLGQRIYLGATAMQLGCCGIGAYYDSEAMRLLGLNDESRLLYLVAAGPVRKYAQR